MAESYRTRLQKALAPCEDVFSTLPCELSARIISEMPPNSLARLALSSKALSVRVAVRVTEGELWAYWHVPLFKQACELRSLVCRRASQGSPPVASKEARCNALLSLLAGLKAIEPRAHLIVRLQALLARTFRGGATRGTTSCGRSEPCSASSSANAWQPAASR